MVYRFPEFDKNRLNYLSYLFTNRQTNTDQNMTPAKLWRK